MALARHQAGNAEQRPGWTPPQSAIGGGLSGSGQDNSDPVGRDAVPLDRRGGFAAGAEDAAEPRQHISLEPSHPLRLGFREARLLGQRVVDKGDEPQAASLGRNHLCETRKREAVDNRCGPARYCGKRRRVRRRPKLNEPDRATARPQALDNVPIVEIAAGQLIEAAGNNKGQLAHPSGAS